MSDISDLENRISAAMDRISRGLETLASPAQETDTAELEGLQSALADEKLANAQLTERLSALNGRIEELERSLETSSDAVEKAVEAREAAELLLASARVDAASAEAARDAAESDAKQAKAEVAEQAEKLLELEALKEQEMPDLDLEQSRDALSQIERRLGRIRRTSRQLRGANQQLRDAAESGLSDPNLINQSLVTELNNLKAIRAAEVAEMDVITSALRPLLEVAGGAEATDTNTGGES